MEDVLIIFKYGGSFEKLENESYEYVGGCPDVIIVRRDITYNEFMASLCNLLDLTLKKITLFACFRNIRELVELICIRSDLHMKFFIDDQLQHSYEYTTLFVCVDDCMDETMVGHPEYCRNVSTLLRFTSGSNQKDEVCPPCGEQQKISKSVHVSGVSKYPHVDITNKFSITRKQNAIAEDENNNDGMVNIDIPVTGAIDIMNNGDAETDWNDYVGNDDEPTYDIFFDVNNRCDFHTDVNDDANNGSDGDLNRTMKTISKTVSLVQRRSSAKVNKGEGSSPSQVSTYKWMPPIPLSSNTVEVDAPIVIADGKESMFKAAVCFLHNHGESLDPLQVLEIVHNLSRAVDCDARLARLEERSQHVQINDENLCDSCRARLGTKLFAMYPDDTIVCYKCFCRQGESTSVTGIDFKQDVFIKPGWLVTR